MKPMPLAKVLLAVASPLLFSPTLHANAPIYSDTHIFESDPYIYNTFKASDFLDPAPQTPTIHRMSGQTSSAFSLSAPLVQGLQQTARYLRSQNPNRIVAKRGAKLSNRVLSHTLETLLQWSGELAPYTLQRHFDLIPLTQGTTQTSKFTGYYTPMLKASAQPNAQYRYPIYRSPMANHLRKLSRGHISRGALQGKGLEVAWTNDPIGLFYMQIQGSGILEYSNGKRTSLHFDGSNEHPFRSIAQYMKQRGLINGNLGRERIQQWLYANPSYLEPAMNSNPRYVYFKPDSKGVKTASGLPIVPGHSVAVDTDYIPFGSVVLAEVPIINSKGQTLGAEWKILLPQDRGAAIKGPARMDIYTGKGEQARKIANQLTGHGKAYLLVNRQETQLSQRDESHLDPHSKL